MSATRGIRIGLRDVYYALLLTDEVDDGVSYDAPVRIVGAMTANINPNPSSETLFADDGPMEVAATLGNIELELGVVDIPTATLAVLLGHTFEDGKLKKKSSDIPPWVAIGFRALKSNGSYKYVWLTKGKFMVPSEDHTTKGDSVEFQTPTITGNFVRRDFDDIYQVTGDEDDATFTEEMATDWFTAVTLNDLSSFTLWSEEFEPTEAVEFNLTVTGARDYADDPITGAAVGITVTSDNELEDLSAITDMTLDGNGDGTIAVTLTETGRQTLTVTIDGVTMPQSITVDVQDAL